MNSQVIRPNIPYRGAIPGGIHDGKLIQIKGNIPYGSDMFEVNLLTGHDVHSDRALHISVRMPMSVVVLNTLERNMWGYEQKSSSVFPFSAGQEFTLMILADQTCYRIAVNGLHYWEFVHRIPAGRVNSIYIDGQVMVGKIEFVDRASNFQPSVSVSQPSYPQINPNPGHVPFQPSVTVSQPSYPQINPNPSRVVPGYLPQPAVCPTYPMPGQGVNIVPPPEVAICPQPTADASTNIVYNPKMPCVYTIPYGLKIGQVIHITGRPFLNPTKFSLNVQSGSGSYPQPDIALHFDVRFTDHSIVRNTRLNGAWEREEKTKYSPKSKFPFKPAVNFNLTVGLGSNKFLVALNGQQLHEFHYRLTPVARFNTLYVEKDVIVDSIWVS